MRREAQWLFAVRGNDQPSKNSQLSMRNGLLAAILLSPLLLGAQQTINLSQGSAPDKHLTDFAPPGRLPQAVASGSATGAVLADATPVKLRLKRTVSSADSHVGDTVDFEVLQDVSVDGTLVIPKGGLAFGRVTEAEPRKKLARGGKLEVNLDCVNLVNGGRVALRAVEGGKGGGHVVVMTTSIVASGVLFFPAAPFFLFMRGKDITIPSGAELTAYIDKDVDLDIAKLQQSRPSEAVEADSAKATKGFFHDGTYTNEYFSLWYPLSPEWVTETDLVRKRLMSVKDPKADHLLLAAVHIPQDVTDLRADSSFTVEELPRSASSGTENCKQYFEALTSNLRASKSAKRKGEVHEYPVAGHEFSRADFTYGSGVSDRAVICSPGREYLLLWNIEGAYWDSVNEAVSTTFGIVPWSPAKAESKFAQIQIPQRDAVRLLRKRVEPLYPLEARQNNIRGTVRMRALINKTGDVVNLELLDGPIELATSAVAAVRQWKYRPYLLSGEPIAVNTEVVVTYSAGPT